MVFSIMKLYIPVERRKEAMQILRSIPGRLEIYNEFLGSWIQERDDPCSHILYAEQWKSEDAINEHIRSPLYRRILQVMEFSTRTPEIGFYFISHTKGMDLIESLRTTPQQLAQKEA